MSMTVGQLIEALAEIDPETKVAVSADAEGNSFSGLDEVYLQAIDASWIGERTDELVDPDAVEDEEQDLQDVVVLWRI